MVSEVVVDVKPKEISIAMLEDKRIVEFHKEARSENFSVGNIYWAKIKKVMPGLNACFVDVGYERDAFLHYLDLGSNFLTCQQHIEWAKRIGGGENIMQKVKVQPQLEKEGSIQNVLKTGQEILVQIVKEPISTKGPRLTCELSIAGRNIVLVPYKDNVSVSTKIKSSSERARLKQLIHSIKPKNFGVIVRTVAEGKRVAELDAELNLLVDRWYSTIDKLSRSKKSPLMAYEETSRTVALLRDLFNPSYEAIHINNAEVHREVADYVAQISPEKESVVKLYKGDTPIFDHFSVTKQLKSSFGKNVTYKHGAYLIIEHTEALHVIDVNSGNRSNASEGQEMNALDVNLGAADEIARQLRLRDMGGIIVVDFIDMGLAENRQMLYERMCQNMQKDRAKHNILPLSKFGLMQITRQRVRPALDIKVDESCPTCSGTGVMNASYLFTEIIEQQLEILVKRLGIKQVKVHVHPYVYAYLNQGFWSQALKWKFRFSRGIKIISNQELGFLQYQFYDKDGELIEMGDQLQ